MPTELICEWCEKAFYSKIRSLKQRFCSRQCAGKHKATLSNFKGFKENEPSWNKGLKNWRKNYQHSDETKRKIGLANKKQNPKYAESYLLRRSAEYKSWRAKVFERDNYKCQKCGNNKKLHPHHIKSFADYPELRFNINNGITLCGKCHGKIHNIDFDKTKRKLVCLNCDQKFDIVDGKYDRKFCSKKCHYEYRSKIPSPMKGKKYPHLQRARIGICLVCGKKFRAVKDFKDKKQKYCSQQCYLFARWGYTNQEAIREDGIKFNELI